MNVLTAMITITLVVVMTLGNIISANSELAKSEQVASINDDNKSIQVSQEMETIKIDNSSSNVDPFMITLVSDPLKDSSTQNIEKSATSLQAQAQPVQAQALPTSNPLLEKEEFVITVANIQHDDILVSLTVDGLKNSTIIPGNPPQVVNPTTTAVSFKFDRHQNAGTPGVLPIKLGDQYTACISLASNIEKATCLSAGIDSVTQPQKKTLDVKYIPI